MKRTRSGREIGVPNDGPPSNKQQVKITESPSDALINWQRLPEIVQKAILGELAEDYNRYSLEDKRYRAAYAAVDLQWQKFFEKLNFDKLVLRSSDLKDFGNIVKRRLQSRKGKNGGRERRESAADASPSLYCMPKIRHIWLCVELRPYKCRECKFPEERREEQWNNVIFTQAVLKLLNILSDWEKQDSSQKLTLELSAYSPSDAHHDFRDNAGLQYDYPRLDPISTQRDYIMRYEQNNTSGDNQLNSPFHGYLGGVHSSATTRKVHPEYIAKRVIRPLEFDFFGVQPTRPESWATRRHRLPEVKMISSFVLRRQFYRELAPLAFGQLLRETLTGLRDIKYERWRLPNPADQKFYELAFGPMEMDGGITVRDFGGEVAVLRHGLPPSLERLSLFEETSSKSPEYGVVDAAYRMDTIPSTRIRVLKGLAGRADNLKHLSVAFLSDAMSCFKFPAGALPNLQSLAVTSQGYLVPTEWKVRRILRAAATAVTKLPRLQIMELWNCENEHAAILRYEAGGALQSRTCQLTWRSSWHLKKSTIEDMISAWEDTAWKASRQLSFVQDPLPSGEYYQYGEILRHLKLRDFILDPISAMQARVGIDEEGAPEVPAWRPSVPYTPARSAGNQD